jgi:predicted ArsR family transcriptional regulator
VSTTVPQTDLSPRDLPAGPTLGESRERVLTALRAAGGPVGRAEVARRTGLHPNTARFHLDGLVSAGLAERRGAQRGGPGRPRTLYAASADDAGGRRSYRLLAAILTAYLAGNTRHPVTAAAGAGEAWGQLLMQRSPRSRRVGARAATGILLETLAELGFEPETGDEGRILLHHCPFREAALEQPDVVCGIHLGLMQGVVNEISDGTIEVEGLEPFVEPNLCAATVVKGERRS